MRALALALIGAVLLSGTAEARKRVIYRVAKRVPVVASTPIEAPAGRYVRTIPIYCSERSATFDEVWCHRVERAEVAGQHDRMRVLFRFVTSQ